MTTPVLLCLWLAMVGGPASAELPADVVKSLDRVIAAERERLFVPGMSVAVAVNNALVYARGFGNADLENALPATADTVYRTASIAKAITATAVMQLAEEGSLDLDAPIQRYCAAFPEKNWTVTPRLLLGHLSGVRHYVRAGESAGTQHFDSIEASLALFKDDPLLHKPGLRFSYTTFGYNLLGCAIEHVSHSSYEQYLRERIFAPAQMTATRLDHYFAIVPNRARGCERLDEATYAALPEIRRTQLAPGQICNSPLHDTSMKVPGGGLLSTAPDLVRFAMAMMTDILVDPETCAAMWTKQKTSDGRETAYGLGFEVEAYEHEATFGHSGNQAGARSALWLRPSRGVAIAIMSNLEGADLDPLMSQLRKVVATASK